MKTKRVYLIFRILTVFTMVVIFLLSSQPSQSSYQVSEKFSQVIKADMKADDGSLISADDVENYKIESDESTNLDYFVFDTLNTRKVGHILLYFVLGVFTFWSFGGKGKFVIAFFIDYLYACTDETHQHFVGRTGLFTDTLYDGTGILAALLICALISKIISSVMTEKRLE